MKSKPLVSILIPTYNQENFIEKCIKSVIAQDYSNLEIIIADDCSTDKTKEIAQSYADTISYVKYFRNNQNIGRVNNYRKALYEYATGDYAINVDGDDQLIDNSFISYGINLIEMSSPQALMLVACKKKLYIGGKETLRQHKIQNEEIQVPGIHFIVGLYSKYFFAHLTTIYNRKMAVRNNFYALDIESTDMLSILNLAILGDVILSRRVVGQWNGTGNNLSTNFQLENSMNNLILIDKISKKIKYKVNKFVYIKWLINIKYKFSRPIIISLYKNPKKILPFLFSSTFIKMLPGIILFLIRTLYNFIQNFTKKVLKNPING